MVIGPYAVMRYRQNIAGQYVEAETKNHIQLLGANFFQRLRRKTVDEFLPDRFDLNALDSVEHGRAIDDVEGMMVRFHFLVKAKVCIVKCTLAKCRSQKPVFERAETRSWRCFR